MKARDNYKFNNSLLFSDHEVAFLINTNVVSLTMSHFGQYKSHRRLILSKISYLESFSQLGGRKWQNFCKLLKLRHHLDGIVISDCMNISP